ncbi:Uncharacterised protein [Limosilactobacillus oris]|nr:Uncharacterised protein [Limosilactobacillus oris]
MASHNHGGASSNLSIHKPIDVKKLTLGVASVALGTTFILANSTVAHADDANPNQGSSDNSAIVTNGDANQGTAVNLPASQLDDDSDHTGEPSVPEENRPSNCSNLDCRWSGAGSKTGNHTNK